MYNQSKSKVSDIRSTNNEFKVDSKRKTRDSVQHAQVRRVKLKELQESRRKKKWSPTRPEHLGSPMKIKAAHMNEIYKVPYRSYSRR